MEFWDCWGRKNIADFHARAVQSLQNANLVGICGTNQEKVNALALRYSCKVFKDTTEMFQSPEVDIVLIATPSGVHMEPAVEAARYGKQVLCEKPLEVNLKRIDKMIKVHKDSGTQLGGIFNYRFNDVVRI